MANISPFVTEPNKREDLTTRRIQVFARSYGTNALYLAYHAAFPLTLTSDLLYCLRENFVPDVPWYAVADVLLSGLCQPVGYDLYEMEGETRDGLLRSLCNQFGEQRLKELANFMSRYIESRLQFENNDRALVFGQCPEWTALAYLSSDQQQVINVIKQKLQSLTACTDTKERIRWAALVESYAELLSSRGFEPLLLEWSQQTLDSEPIQDEEDKKIAVATGVSLQPFEFDIATVTLEDEPTEELQTFEFETITVDARGQVINQQRNQAFYFEEFLGEVETNSTNNYGQEEHIRAELNGLLEGRKAILEQLTYTTSSVETLKLQNNLGRIEEKISEFEQTLHNFQTELGKPSALLIEMVAIPGGTFEMGSPPDEPERYDNESPQHTVTVQPFFLAKYPVTQEQWRFVAQLPQVNQELEQYPSNSKGANCPVEHVSWYDAVEFCDRLSQYTGRPYSLPSEAEWEYACRAGTTTPFHFGKTITSELANYRANEVYGQGVKRTYRTETTPVGSFEVANAFGLYDMHGNVWEWCLDDWHRNYEGAPTDGSPWFDDNNVSEKQGDGVLRGGSWIENPSYCRSAYRHDCARYDRYDLYYGFRVICEGRRI